MDVTPQVIKYFKIKCKNCKSKNVLIDFYQGFIYDNGGTTGHLIISCENKDCNTYIDIEDNI